MPTRARRLCAYPGCSAITEPGEKWCREHACTDLNRREEFDRAATPWHRMYYRKDWKIIRKTQLMKEPFCRECRRAGRIVPATDVDHIVPHRGDLKLFYSADNLQSLCHTCHSRKTAEEVRSKGEGGGQKVRGGL